MKGLCVSGGGVVSCFGVDGGEGFLCERRRRNSFY